MKKHFTTLILLMLTISSYAGKGFLENKAVIDSSKSESVFKIKKNLTSGDFTARQVVKLNLSQLALKNISLQYEYGFHKNMSAALGVSFLLPSQVPSTFISDPSNGITETAPTYNGWAITPEFRFYPGKKEKHQAPHGFYLAPFIRYSAFNVNTTITSDSTNVSVGVNIKYSGFTAGLMIGSQWLIGKHFAIDWWILGGGFGSATLQMDASSKNASMSQSDQNQLASDVKSSLNNLSGNTSVTVSTTSNSLEATISGLPKYTVRGFGLCLGYYF